MQNLDTAHLFTSPDPGEQVHWAEHLRVGALSVGTYSIPAGAPDHQEPHSEDEIYVVVSGRGAFEAAGSRVEVGPGSTLYVAAHEVHRFVDVSEDLVAVVVFAPPEGSAARG
jgi:mannose-6-phosphate isomerase-like protein (cupin superfamily)